MTNDQESVLIERIVKGESAGYQVLYDSHLFHLFRFLKQFKRNDDDVKELVQRAFIKAFEALPSFKSHSTFRSWLFRIALNEMKSDIRRNSIITFVEIDAAITTTPIDDTEQLEWNSTLRTLFDGLDDIKRSVFILYEVEGYSHAEIAEMLSIGESTSRTILTRTKHWLRTQLTGLTRIS